MNLDLDLNRLLAALDRFSAIKVLVLGDVMLDRFIWGRVERISPEAPVPVVEVESETCMLGGAANVLHNLVALGGQASLCGLVGRDQSGREVQELLDDLEVNGGGLIESQRRRTTVKTRVVAHSQQVVRVDREDRTPMHPDELASLLDHLRGKLGQCQAVIVSDYAKGVVCPQLMEPLMAMCHEAGIIVSVDPKVVNMPLFKGATVITPNHHEALAASGVGGRGPEDVVRAGQKLLDELGAQNVLVTQGAGGMSLFNARGRISIPALAKEVYDVTGAGDTVISTLTLALAAGLEPSEAAFVANTAAGVVVGEVGTSAVTVGRLAQSLKQSVAQYQKGSR